MTLLRKGNDTYDTDTGVATSTFTEYPVTAVMVQYTKQEIADDPSYLRDDRKAYIVPKNVGSFSIEIGDRIRGVGENVLVVSVREVLKDTDSSMVYVCQVRG
jgi:hypothetical protein